MQYTGPHCHVRMKITPGCLLQQISFITRKYNPSEWTADHLLWILIMTGHKLLLFNIF
jgi:hypothetical protein